MTKESHVVPLFWWEHSETLLLQFSTRFHYAEWWVQRVIYRVIRTVNQSKQWQESNNNIATQQTVKGVKTSKRTYHFHSLKGKGNDISVNIVHTWTRRRFIDLCPNLKFNLLPNPVSYPVPCDDLDLINDVFRGINVKYCATVGSSWCSNTTYIGKLMPMH